MKNDGIRILSEEEIEKSILSSIGYHACRTDFCWVTFDSDLSDILFYEYLVYRPNGYSYVPSTGSFYRNNFSINGYYEYGKEKAFQTKNIGIRPVIPLDLIPEKSLEKAYQLKDGVYRILYGLYPVPLVNKADYIFSRDKNKMDVSFNILGREYSIYSGSIPSLLLKVDDRPLPDIPQFLGVNSNDAWFRIMPLTWFIDSDLKVAISQDILFAGVPIHHDLNYQTFEETNLYNYLNNEFKNNLMLFEKNKLFETENYVPIEDKTIGKKEAILDDNITFEDIVMNAQKQMDEILGKSYTKKINK